MFEVEVEVKEALLTAVVRGASNFGLLEGGAETAAFLAVDCLVTRGVVMATGDIAFGDFFSLEDVSSSASLMLSSSDFITIATAKLNMFELAEHNVKHWIDKEVNR